MSARAFMTMADALREKGYRIGQKLGEGTYSKVWVVERRSDQNILAVKVITKKKSKDDYELRFMPRELALVLHLKHENVISTYEVFENKEFVFQVMQYAAKGNLLDYIQTNSTIPEDVARKIFIGMTRGIKYLHDSNVVHRDLKCENILLRKDRSAVISDFGFSRKVDKNGAFCQTYCGSTAYASPELLQSVPYNPKASDIWSLGCILFTMLCGTMPFDDTNVKDMIEQQVRREITYPERVTWKISKNCKRLVLQLLEPDAKKRLTADEIQASEWLKDMK